MQKRETRQSRSCQTLLESRAGIPSLEYVKNKSMELSECGGPPGDRTRDTLIKSQVLYH